MVLPRPGLAESITKVDRGMVDFATQVVDIRDIDMLQASPLLTTKEQC